MNLALVHDWLNQIGGAEDVLETLVELYPQAPLYTSMYWRSGMPAAYRDWDIRTTWMDRLPGIHQHHQPFLPLYPLAFERLDLSSYDVVLSNKSGFCHGVHTGPDTTHICYCLAPTRYVWAYDEYAVREALSPVVRTALKPLIRRMRRWDYRAAQRVDHFVAISTEIQTRIRQFYDRDATIIFPPVDTSHFVPSDRIDDYFLIVSRLVPYKRIDLAVRAFNRSGQPLVIAGAGRDREALEAMAASNITFLGYVPDADLPDLLARCRAYVLPGKEDFCIAPVQAMAAGRPVIAYGSGGALDTVIPGKTGLHFQEPTPESLLTAVQRFGDADFDPGTIRRHAFRFDKSVFESKLREYVRRFGVRGSGTRGSWTRDS
jgi:glycosyltransferase involved in cell wall biosynthesis